MPNYNHMLLIVDYPPNDDAFSKANFLANCFGARLSIGYPLPTTPTISSGVVNLEIECRKVLKSQLSKIGECYKIPLEDQWVLSQDEHAMLERLRKNGIDLIIVSTTIQPFELRSQLTSKLLLQYSCAVLFVNDR